MNNLYLLIKKWARRLQSQAGTGLAESLVALAILGVSLTALVTDLSAGSIAVRTQDEMVTAQQLAQNQMEAVKAAPYAAAYSGVSPPEGYEVATGVDAGLYGNENIQKITVTVSHGGGVIYTLEGYKVRR